MFTQLQNLLTDPKRQEEMFEELYRELKVIARSRMAGERAAITLSPTALVHEAWMRLENSTPQPWRDRRHFFAAASESMRRLLVDAARRRNAAKRGGGVVDVPLDGIDLPEEADDSRVLAVNEALGTLELKDPMKAQIVKLRFYCGMENGEIAAVLGVNERTVRRHWEVAKLKLFQSIRET